MKFLETVLRISCAYIFVALKSLEKTAKFFTIASAAESFRLMVTGKATTFKSLSGADLAIPIFILACHTQFLQVLTEGFLNITEADDGQRKFKKNCKKSFFMNQTARSV